MRSVRLFPWFTYQSFYWIAAPRLPLRSVRRNRYLTERRRLTRGFRFTGSPSNRLTKKNSRDELRTITFMGEDSFGPPAYQKPAVFAARFKRSGGAGSPVVGSFTGAHRYLDGHWDTLLAGLRPGCFLDP